MPSPSIKKEILCKNKIVKIGNIDVANDKPFVLFGGMNVLESRDMAMQVCEAYVKGLKSWAFLMF